MRRVFALVGAALLWGGVAIPVAAIADTYEDDQSMGEFSDTADAFELDAAEPGDPYPIKDEMTKFEFGAPGELIVNASHGFAAFPVPVDPLVFDTEAEFLDFMVDMFNAKIVTDPSTGKSHPSLTVTTYGTPYIDDSSGPKPVPVDDPVETFLGGPGGYYLVEGKVRCTDPSRCELECLPPAAQSGFITATTDAAVQSSPTSAAQAVSATQAIATLAASAPFKAVGRYEFSHRSSYDPNGATAYIFTEQSSGPLPFGTAICNHPAVRYIIGRLVKIPGLCSTPIHNPNQLWMSEIEATSSQFEDSCRIVTSAALSSPRYASNVSRFSFKINFIQFAGYQSLSGLKSRHGGEQDGETVDRTKCWSGGCFKRDPCVP